MLGLPLYILLDISGIFLFEFLMLTEFIFYFSMLETNWIFTIDMFSLV